MVFFLIALYFNTFCGGNIKIYTAHTPFNLLIESESEVTQPCPTLWDPKDCKPTMLLRPWDFPGKRTGIGCLFLLFHLPDLGIGPGSPHCRQTLYHLSHQGSQFTL